MHPTAVLVACLATAIGSVISYPVLVFEQTESEAPSRPVRSLKCVKSGSSVRCSDNTEERMTMTLLKGMGPSGAPYVIIEEAEMRTAMEDAAAEIRQEPATKQEAAPFVMTQDSCPEGTVYVSEIDLCLEMEPPTTTPTPRPWSQVFVECKENEIYLSELDICVPVDNCYPYPDCSQVPTTPAPKPSRLPSVFDYGSKTSPLYTSSNRDREAASHVRIMEPIPAGSSTTRNEISFADLIKSTYDFKKNLV